jgi:putative ABC transport system permease protein
MKFWTWPNRRRREEELDEEIQAHLRMAAQERAEQGERSEQARAAATREFGNVALVKEVTRDMWGYRWLETLLQDIRYGLRQLHRNPGFTVVAVVTLALGIGMNSALFSVINAVLWRPLAYPDPAKLIWLADYDPNWGDNWVMPAAFALWHDRVKSFESLVAYGNQDVAFASRGVVSQERVASVSNEFWQMTGAEPALGRLFKSSEADTIVLSHAVFERRFSSDPKVIGKAVSLNGHTFTVTGVLPQDFRFLFPQQFASGDVRRDIDAYIPLPSATLKFWTMKATDYEALKEAVGPTPHGLCVIGRIKPGVSPNQARNEMQMIFTAVKQDHYPSYSHVWLDFAPLQEKLVEDTRPALYVLFSAVCFVLLIAVANVANLLLGRASARRREIAIRTAIGAGRTRLLRQFVVESFLLSCLGGAAGLILARWALVIVTRMGVEIVPRIGEAKINGGVILFTLAVSFVTGLVFGLAPATSILRTGPAESLVGQFCTSQPGRNRAKAQAILVATEVALALVLLTGTGLMLKSLWRMNAYPSGFEPAKILTMRVPLYGPNYDVWLRQDEYIHRLLRRLEPLPGVRAVGVYRGTLNTHVEVEGAVPSSPDRKPFAEVEAVSSGYLRALGAPLIKGNWPREDSFDTFIVNESFVRRILGNRDPVGRHLNGAIMNGTIVGEVANFKTWQLDADVAPEVYVPYQLQPYGRSIRVIVRTAGDPGAVAPTVRRLASEIDPAQPVSELQTLEHALSDSIAPRRFNLFLLGAFAAVALAMGMIGTYGVLSYLAAQRTREIAIRMALGAQKKDVLGMVVGQGFILTSIGVGIGIAGSLALAKYMTSMLYGVTPTDPSTFIAVSLLLSGVALVACYIPARRATKVDPMVALRYE